MSECYEPVELYPTRLLRGKPLYVQPVPGVLRETNQVNHTECTQFWLQLGVGGCGACLSCLQIYNDFSVKIDSAINLH